MRGKHNRPLRKAITTGAYNILLGHAFPVVDGYVVHPQVAPVDFRRDALDFVVYFRIDLHRIPVFFVEVKTALAIKNLSARADADDQMRLRLRQLFDQSLTELHGISALGTRLCFYCLDKNTESLTPRPIPQIAAYINDTAPADRWDADILTDDGFNRFMNIVEHVKALAAVEGV
ncbi:hypothetical protein PILCRDRAFT_11507 [Piloderma croceum F 1598]|uniref:Fungal-type protein kinase domain-containing protein n=1 Tax=Piloderma croceum (strain F 1598) TaxID=765440 RepID=A0A0C3FDV7_PILCF|nr:hypothetical protein PILCRDRAFT_11507 [Piloderma croceum F 1598]